MLYIICFLVCFKFNQQKLRFSKTHTKLTIYIYEVKKIIFDCQFERRQHLDFMKKSWIDQVKEREAAMEKQKADEYVRLKDEESRRKEEEEIEKLCNRHKEEEIALLKSQIKSQMEAVR